MFDRIYLSQAVEALRKFDDWLSEFEDKLEESTSNKPKTRVEACQLLAIVTVSDN